MSVVAAACFVVVGVLDGKKKEEYAAPFTCPSNFAKRRGI
jgi:hypothetical protein